jgi:hypothetical protein
VTNILNFSTRIQNDSNMGIDNIFADYVRLNCSTSPTVNGLSDRIAQYIMINNIAVAGNLALSKQKTGQIMKQFCSFRFF